jgi:hypothetical protein
MATWMQRDAHVDRAHELANTLPGDDNYWSQTELSLQSIAHALTALAMTEELRDEAGPA